MPTDAFFSKCWLARIETARFPASHVCFIRCAMGVHVAPAAWPLTGAGSDALRFEEFSSTDLAGRVLDVSKRHPISKQLSPADAGAMSVSRILGSSDQWQPGR
ncbi:hypothetical protein [Chthoniobacter flavus]|uniref:hypothetical protein n=1 Tax=Chthoniobacter flavus TaxID=191863 RepID=UPI00138AB92E|nr:hypothetical protein [Chthoniobacter flavus]